MVRQMRTKEESSPYRRPGFLLGAAVVGIIVVMGIAVAISSALRPDPATAPPVAPTPTAPTSSTDPGEDQNGPPGEQTDPDASVCGLPGFVQTGTLTAPPEGSSWRLAGRTAVPYSDQAGPGEFDPTTGMGTCFAHTPEGAVTATATIMATTLKADTVLQATEYFVVPGPGKDAAVARIQEQLAAGEVPDEEATSVQVAGFRVLSYNSDRATIELAFDYATGGTGAFRYELEWIDGDWRYRVADDGGMLGSAQQVDDMTNYVEWRGI